uniref:Uncharacterized protein n=1 Tax=Steinernema glaseri TaxID=37863 RepID=A0A1I7YZU6_9BILA
MPLIPRFLSEEPLRTPCHWPRANLSAAIRSANWVRSWPLDALCASNAACKTLLQALCLGLKGPASEKLLDFDAVTQLRSCTFPDAEVNQEARATDRALVAWGNARRVRDRGEGKRLRDDTFTKWARRGRKNNAPDETRREDITFRFCSSLLAFSQRGGGEGGKDAARSSRPLSVVVVVVVVASLRSRRY